MIKCFNKNRFTFKEHRFLFDTPETPAPETEEHRKERLNNDLRAAGKDAGIAIVKLLGTGIQAATFAMDTLTEGVGQVKRGYKFLEGKFVGKLKPLPEYVDLERNFHSISRTAGGGTVVERLDVSDPTIEAITGFDVQTACLGLSISRLNLFYGEALRELQTIDGLQDRSVVGGDISIELRERILRDKSILKRDPRDTMAKADLQEAQHQLDLLKNVNTTGFKRPMPTIVRTEFPPGSARYLPRLVLDKSNMVYLRLEDYKKYLRDYVSDYERQINLFSGELDKIYYWRQAKIVQSNITPAQQIILDKNRGIIRAKLIQIQGNDDTVGFDRDPNDVYQKPDGTWAWNPPSPLKMYLKR